MKHFLLKIILTVLLAAGFVLAFSYIVTWQNYRILSRDAAEEKQINRDAGLFPYGNETAYRFGMLMKESSKQLDLLAVWHTVMQDYLVNCVCPSDMVTTSLADIEPYYCSHPWTSALAGKKVVVVHPFQKTIEEQYRKREKLGDTTR